MHRLITLKFSHYNDKARWALERCGVPFEERGFMPGFSSAAVALYTRGRGGATDRASTRFSTPVLLMEDGSGLYDSTDIARFASRYAGTPQTPDPLFPHPGVLERVQDLGERLGPYTRFVSYWHALNHPEMFGALARANVSPRQAAAFRFMEPLGKIMLRRGLKMTPARHDKSMDRINAVMDEVAEVLEGSPYLAGERFTAADLTFAALMSPVLLVTPEEGYGATLPALDALGPESRRLVEEIRSHPAGQFALRMYREERQSAVRKP